MPSETRSRSIVKAITWQAVGLLTMTAIAFAVTGNFTASGGLAATGAIVGFVCFILHERIWARVSWGQTGSQNTAPADQSHGSPTVITRP